MLASNSIKSDLLSLDVVILLVFSSRFRDLFLTEIKTSLFSNTLLYFRDFVMQINYIVSKINKNYMVFIMYNDKK